MTAARKLDATQAALDAAVAPFLDQALHAFLLDTGMGGHSPSEYMRAWLYRCSYLYALPLDVALELILFLLAMTCVMQFALSILAIMYWKRGLISTTSNDDKATDTTVSSTAHQKKE